MTRLSSCCQVIALVNFFVAFSGRRLLDMMLTQTYHTWHFVKSSSASYHHNDITQQMCRETLHLLSLDAPYCTYIRDEQEGTIKQGNIQHLLYIPKYFKNFVHLKLLTHSFVYKRLSYSRTLETGLTAWRVLLRKT